MSRYSSSATPACQSVGAFRVDADAAWALVRLAKFRPETKTDGDSDGLVIQPEAAGRNRQSVEPVSAVRRRQCQQTCLVSSVCEADHKASDIGRDTRLVPLALLPCVDTDGTHDPCLAVFG